MYAGVHVADVTHAVYLNEFRLAGPLGTVTHLSSAATVIVPPVQPVFAKYVIEPAHVPDTVQPHVGQFGVTSLPTIRWMGNAPPHDAASMHSTNGEVQIAAAHVAGSHKRRMRLAENLSGTT
jgi:hypothetical protein